ncbi:hypothetical protein ACFLZZ_00620 [Nanoarchaeota archaeon]
MKKGLMFLSFGIILVLSMQLVLAETNIKYDVINNLVVKELTNSAKFNLSVTNNGDNADDFIVDSLLAVTFTPRELGEIKAGQTKMFEISVAPSSKIRDGGDEKSSFEYFVKGDNTQTVKGSLIVKVVSFSQVMNIIFPTVIKAEDESITMDFKLEEDLEFEGIVSIESELFSEEFEESFELGSNEVTFDLEGLDEMNSGVYETTFTFEVGEDVVVLTKDIILGSVLAVEETVTKEGIFLSRDVTTTKTNNGNSVTEVTISITKSTLASLFTSFTGAPKTKKEGGKYIYEWSKELNPGETYSVTVTTNYYLPLLVLLLLIVAVIVYRIVTAPDVKITKKAMRLKTKSGVFASKIVVNVKNIGKPITNIKVIERLPAFTEILKDKFGTVTPSEIKKRSVIWDFSKLDVGEELMFSYVIYSKIDVFGKLEVPPAVITYRDQKEEFREEQSNRIYLLSEEKTHAEEY